jgi:two-component system, OmpR family, sensor histidine kinase KdpD
MAPKEFMDIRPNHAPSRPVIRTCLLVALMILVITAVGKGLQPAFDLVNIALLYLLPVLVSAVLWGMWPSVAASLAGMLSFDYFFVPPVMSFTVSDIRHFINFALFLVVALVTGTLAARLRTEAGAARDREYRTAALYSLSQRIAGEFDIREALGAIVETVVNNVGADAAILTPGLPYNSLEIAAHSGKGEFSLSHKEKAAARLAFEHGQQTASGTEAAGESKVFFVPVTEGEKGVGVLAVRPAGERSLSSEQEKDLKAFASLTALAITRAHLSIEAEQAKWLAESEKLHRSLLNAVSHDLRTPLSSIMGAVTGLLTEGDVYEPEAKIMLLRTIREGARRMNRFITNLLDMARLESGILRLNREWCDIVDIIGVSLKEVEDSLPSPRLELNLPDVLPLVEVDFGLIEQVLINLLENSVKYSPPESRISVSVCSSEKEVRVTVADDGPAIPENDRDLVFDKFYRLRSSKHVSGTGLGLSICKGIVEAHGGRIWVEPGDEKGNRFILALRVSPQKQPVIPEGSENHGG